MTKSNAELADEIEQLAALSKKATQGEWEPRVIDDTDDVLLACALVDWFRANVAALRASPPSGDFVLVPREPTMEMKRAGAEWIEIRGATESPYTTDRIMRAADTYRAMLTAAQTELAKAKEDARRYRFLTEPHNDWHVARWISSPRGSGTWSSIHGAALTKAIDEELNDAAASGPKEGDLGS